MGGQSDFDRSGQGDLERAIAKLEAAFQSGQVVDLEGLIDEFHRADDVSAAVELIYAEISLRRERGEIVSIESYLERFPEYAEPLQKLLDIDQAIEQHDETKLGPESSASNVGSTQDAQENRETAKSRVIGPYKILQEIGHGGMGTVYMAEQSEPVRRRVALKIVRSGIDSKEVATRFEAERQALAMMDHTNIAKVLDAGTTDDGVPYFVMELVRGIPITDYCDKYQLSIPDRLNLFNQACRAIQHAHQKGIIHRDIKPSNVLVMQHDGKPLVKVIDFGLAKALQNTHRLTDKTMFTEFGQVVGTLQYMSPEQTEMDSLDVDTRSDVYSLGVLLYELLTGSTPIERQSLKQLALDKVMTIIRDEEPQRPSQRLSSAGDTATQISQQRKTDARKLGLILKGDLDWIAMKALEKDRTRRYDSPVQLSEDVERFLTGEAILARPPSLAYRFSKTFRKHRPAIIAASLVFLALTVGLIVAAWQWKRAETALSDLTQLNENLEQLNVDLATQKNIAEKQTSIAKIESANAEVAKELATQRADDLANANKAIESNLAQTNYRLAIARWGQNRVVEAIGYLERVPEEHRYVEWHLARNQFEGKGSDFTCYGHTDDLTSVSFSPDGQRIVSGSKDGTVKVWNAQTGGELRTLTGHEGDVTSLSFSPDGQRIVSGSKDNTLNVWDAQTGEELRKLRGHDSYVYSVSFSPDGQQIVSGSWDDTLKVWDAQTGEELRTLTGHQSDVTSVSFSPDGQRIVSGSWDSALKVWDSQTGEELRTLTGHRDTVSSVSFSPDGRNIISGSEDLTIKVWDAQTGEELRTLRGHQGDVTRVSFSPDGQWIVSGSTDDTVKLWDAQTGEELRTLKGHRETVSSVAFSPDGHRIVSGSLDKSLKVWDTPTGEELRTLRWDVSYVTSVSFSPDGQQIVSGSTDNTLKVWDTPTGAELRTLTGHQGDVTSVSFSLDGQRIVSGSLDNSLKVWDTQTGNELRTLRGHRGDVSSVSFSPDGQRIVSGSKDGTVKVWDTQTGNELRTLRGHEGEVSSVSFSPDGQQIVSGSTDDTLKVWDTQTGEELRTLREHRDVNSVAFSPDGQRIVSGSWDDTVKVWDAQTGKELGTLKGHDSYVRSVSFSPDGQLILSSDRWGKQTVWNLESGKQLDLQKTNPSDLRMFDNNRSSDGRWLVLLQKKQLWLIDQQYKNQPRVRAFRTSKATPDPFWHNEQAQAANKANDQFAHLFHRAWLVKIDADDEDNRRKFEEAYQKFTDENPDQILPKVAEEVHRSLQE